VNKSIKLPPSPFGLKVLDYAALGLYLLPLYEIAPSGRCSCNKPNCVSPGKHPQTPRGFHDATTDAEAISKWWGWFRTPNVGIAPGPSGLVVIDIDPRNGGDESWGDLVAQYGDPLAGTPTVTCLTGGGGRHFYYKVLEGVTLKRDANPLGPGIDVKGDGGFVVAPPSNHVSGGVYEWEIDCSPHDLPFALLPDPLLNLLCSPGRTKRPRQARVTGGSDTVNLAEGPPADLAAFESVIELLVAHWPSASGSRHALALALVGGLLREQVPADIVAALVTEVAARGGDEEWQGRARLRDVVATRNKLEMDEPVTGWPTVAGLLEDDELVEQVRELVQQSMSEMAGVVAVSSVLSVSSPGGSSPLSTTAEAQQDTEPAPVTPFPIEVLPPVVQRYVAEAAASLPCPPEFVAVPLLVCAGAAIGRSVSIQLKLAYQEHPVLFAAIIGEPGAKKSPALSFARKPLDVLQEEAMERFRQERRGLSEEERAAQELDLQPDHLYTTDPTMEAVAKMAATSQGLVLCKDELVAWTRACDMYRAGKGTDRQSWLSLWTSSPLKVDRKGADSLHVPYPRVSVVGAIQPDMVGALADESRRQEGFMERILWAWPQPVRGHWTDVEVSREAEEAVIVVFRIMRGMAGPVLLGLSPEAKSSWVAWHDQLEDEIQDLQGPLAGTYSKLAGQTARLAVILHCLAHPGDEQARTVDATTMAGAVKLGEYFAAHARRVFEDLAQAVDEGTALDARVAELLRRAQGEWVAKSVLHIELWGKVKKRDLDEALKALQHQGIAQQRWVKPGKGTDGGRPREEWRYISPHEKTEDTEETCQDVAAEGATAPSNPDSAGGPVTPSTPEGLPVEVNLSTPPTVEPIIHAATESGDSLAQPTYSGQLPLRPQANPVQARWEKAMHVYEADKRMAASRTSKGTSILVPKRPRWKSIIPPAYRQVRALRCSACGCHSPAYATDGFDLGWCKVHRLYIDVGEQAALRYFPRLEVNDTTIESGWDTWKAYLKAAPPAEIKEVLKALPAK
jgi:hypothetical protein